MPHGSDGAHFGIDDVSGGQRTVKLQLAYDVAQRRRRQVLDGCHRSLYAVGEELAVGDLKEYDRIDLHSDVVLGNDGLRLEVCDLLH